MGAPYLLKSPNGGRLLLWFVWVRTRMWKARRRFSRFSHPTAKALGKALLPLQGLQGTCNSGKYIVWIIIPTRIWLTKGQVARVSPNLNGRGNVYIEITLPDLRRPTICPAVCSAWVERQSQTLSLFVKNVLERLLFRWGKWWIWKIVSCKFLCNLHLFS